MEIAEFQNLMKVLYQKNDNNRGLNGTVLWFFEEVGEFSEAIRQYQAVKPEDAEEKSKKKDHICEEMADIVAWLASVANLLEIDLEKALLDKYPNKCLKCGNNPCTCEKK